MKTYLLTWNPKRYSWPDFEEDARKFYKNGFFEKRWTSGNNKSILEGDRLFLLRQGMEPRGIVASGWATSGFFESGNFDPRSYKDTALYVEVRFDILLNPDPESIYPRQNLEAGKFATASSMTWDARASGTTIPSDVTTILEKEWASFLAKKNVIQSGRPLSTLFPDEVPNSKDYYEGATKSVRVNVYERRDAARSACIKHYGTICCICGFDFAKVYGAMGIGFIHVHHLKPLSEIGKEYRVDPIKDLRPVCPNCHSMIHRGKQTHSIEEIRQQLRK